MNESQSKSRMSTSIHLSAQNNTDDDSTILQSVGSTNEFSQSSRDTSDRGTIGYDDMDDTSEGRYRQQLVSTDSQGGNGNIKYRVYARRWGILAQFCALILGNATLWVTFAPISNTAEDYFGLAGTTTRVNMLAIVFLILYPVGTALEVYCMQYYKLRRTLLIGGALTVCGSFLRVVAVVMKEYGLPDVAVYILILIGQMFAAVAQPLFMNCPASISAAWFPPSERDISTSCGSLFSPLGNAVGSVFPIIFVNHEQTMDEMNRGMVGLMMAEFGICVIPLVVAYLFFEAAPPTAPSYSTLLKHDAGSKLSGKKGMHIHEKYQEGGGNRARLDTNLTASTVHTSTTINSSKFMTDDLDASLSMTSSGDMNHDKEAESELIELSSRHSAQEWSSTYEQLKSLCGNRNYIFLFMGFILGLGLFTALLTFINQIVLPYGYSNDDAGTFSAVLLFSGLFGAAIVSQVLERTKAYETVLKCGFVLCLAAMTLMVTQLKPDNFSWLCASYAVTGLALLPMLPTVIENTAECTYPDVTEDLSVGLMFMGGNVMGVVMTSILEALLTVEMDKYGIYNTPNEPSTTGFDPNISTGIKAFVRPSNIFMIGILALSICVLLNYKGEYNRLKAENLGQSVSLGPSRSTSTAHPRDHENETYRPPRLDSLGNRTHSSYDNANSIPGIHTVGESSGELSASDSNSTVIRDSTQSQHTVGRTSSVVREGNDVLGALSGGGGGEFYNRTNGNTDLPSTNQNSFKWGASDLSTFSQRETIVSGMYGGQGVIPGGGGIGNGDGNGHFHHTGKKQSNMGTLKNVLDNGR